MCKKTGRRAALGAFVLTSTIVLNGALAQPRSAFGGARVDLASLRAEVGDPTARWVAEELPGAVTEALASVGRAGTSRGADRHRDLRAERRRPGPTWHVARSDPRRRGEAAPRVHQLLSEGRRPGARRTVQTRSRLATRAGLRLLGGAGGLKSPDRRARLSRRSGTGCAILVVDQTRSHARGAVVLLFEDFGDDIDLEHASH
jgi:hypothetical protein